MKILHLIPLTLLLTGIAFFLVGIFRARSQGRRQDDGSGGGAGGDWSWGGDAGGDCGGGGDGGGGDC